MSTNWNESGGFMEYAMYIGGGIAGLIVLLVLIGKMLPSAYHYARSTVIDASPARIHEFVGELRK